MDEIRTAANRRAEYRDSRELRFAREFGGNSAGIERRDDGRERWKLRIRRDSAAIDRQFRHDRQPAQSIQRRQTRDGNAKGNAKPESAGADGKSADDAGANARALGAIGCGGRAGSGPPRRHKLPVSSMINRITTSRPSTPLGA